ncbi:MAG: anaerobic ribonucleoside-triphosphate reductase, partial [Clostridia bacterium]|nr:anaerobic ribonucleoside-triphosphate reductase [Clostridia bacterium]
MNIIKRSGAQAVYESGKIISALSKANETVNENERLKTSDIYEIEATVKAYGESLPRALGVEEIQDMVESEIMKHGAFNVARNYIKYRYIRSLARKANT